MTAAIDLSRLPQPDGKGNYYFLDDDGVKLAAILPVRGAKVAGPARWFAYGPAGVLVDGAGLETFETPGMALKALRRRAGVR